MRHTFPNALMTLMGGLFLATSAPWSNPAAASDPFIGQIQYFPYNFNPRNWAFCNGQLLQISQNTALFSLFGTIYGGDGRVTFALPDMRGRFPVHSGTGPGLTPVREGQRQGVETVTLAANQLPAHTHSLMATSNRGNTTSPTGAVLARDGRDETYRSEAPNTPMHSGAITSTGGGLAHDNMPPYLGLNCNVALTGIFPPRS